MEALICIANVLYLLSYFVRDMIWLRVLTILGAMLLLPYFCLRAEPLMMPVYWNAFFIVLNAWWVVRLIRERRPNDSRNETRRRARRTESLDAAWVVADNLDLQGTGAVRLRRQRRSYHRRGDGMVPPEGWQAAC